MLDSFNTNNDYILQNERVVLRPLEKADTVNLLNYALNEPELWKYSLISAEGTKGLENYIRIALDARNAGKEYAFIVYDKLTKQYAGSTRYYDLNIAFKTLQLGYTWYGKAYHGTGLNKHCKYLLLSFAFEEMGMERVEFRADNENERSKAAMLSIGCKIDGVLRSNMPKREGGRRDSIVLSILKEEWLNGVKEQLSRKLV